MVQLIPLATAPVQSAVIGVSIFIGIIGVGLCLYLIVKRLTDF